MPQIKYMMRNRMIKSNYIIGIARKTMIENIGTFKNEKFQKTKEILVEEKINLCSDDENKYYLESISSDLNCEEKFNTALQAKRYLYLKIGNGFLWEMLEKPFRIQ